jgi:hypothetical protein
MRCFFHPRRVPLCLCSYMIRRPLLTSRNKLVLGVGENIIADSDKAEKETDMDTDVDNQRLMKRWMTRGIARTGIRLTVVTPKM